MKILVIEDDIDLSKALCAILEKENYQTQKVFDGKNGIDYALSGTYDLIILDWMLPIVDGIAVLKKLRDSLLQTPILMLTAKSTLEDKIAGLDSGADDYLLKPFQSKELLARIRALLRRYDHKDTKPLEFGNLTLNKETYQISVGTKTERLSLKEYQLFELLALHPKQLISSTQIYDHIWGLDQDVDMGIVWVYISYLRKKLKKINASIDIKAVRSIGYMFEDKS